LAALRVCSGVYPLPKRTKKQKQEMEQQILSFVTTPAASVVIAAGVAVLAIPHAIKYLIRATELQGLPYVAMLPERIGNAISEHAKETRKAIDDEKKDEWHEANPDVTTLDIDVPAKSGDPYTDYLNLVGLPLSTVLLVVGDNTALAAYRSPVLGSFSSWRYYGVREINNQKYWILIPKGIGVTYKVKVVIDTEAPDEHGLCTGGYTYSKSGDVCEKFITELKILEPIMIWPVYGFTL